MTDLLLIPGILAHYPEPTPDPMPVQESESAPLYRTPPPGPDLIDAWQVGDLCRQGGQLILIVAVGAERQHQAPDASGDLILVRTYRELICLNEVGHSWPVDGPTGRVDFLHNTGLTYDYRNREQLQRDFATGFFTPYFDIL